MKISCKHVGCSNHRKRTKTKLKCFILLMFSFEKMFKNVNDILFDNEKWIFFYHFYFNVIKAMKCQPSYQPVENCQPWLRERALTSRGY